MEQARQAVADVQPRPDVVPLVGFADEVLLKYLSEQPADLIFMGPFHDRGAGSSTAIGPTAQRLVQHAPTSVWMHKGRQTTIRRILACVAVDDTTVVDVATQLGRAMGATVNVLHVVPPTAASYLSTTAAKAAVNASISVTQALAQGTHLSTLLQSWLRQLEQAGLDQDALLLEHGSAPEVILKTAQDGGYDLVVVGSQSGPGQFLGSVANGVVRYAKQSVLVVRTRTM